MGAPPARFAVAAPRALQGSLSGRRRKSESGHSGFSIALGIRRVGSWSKPYTPMMLLGTAFSTLAPVTASLLRSNRKKATPASSPRSWTPSFMASRLTAAETHRRRQPPLPPSLLLFLMQESIQGIQRRRQSLSMAGWPSGRPRWGQTSTAGKQNVIRSPRPPIHGRKIGHARDQRRAA